MILKLRVARRPHAVHGGSGWEYVDGIDRVETHDPPPEDGDPPHRRAFTANSLREWVAETFGPPEIRESAFELWPQDGTDAFCRFATIAVCRLRDGRTALVVATEDCFLLSDAGDTVDRIH